MIIVLYRETQDTIEEIRNTLLGLQGLELTGVRKISVNYSEFTTELKEDKEPGSFVEVASS